MMRIFIVNLCAYALVVELRVILHSYMLVYLWIIQCWVDTMSYAFVVMQKNQFNAEWLLKYRAYAFEIGAYYQYSVE